MTRVVFDTPAGTVEAEAAEGARLLDVARGAGLPLEGTCGGELACATCHLVIDPEDFARLPPPRAEEEDMLDLVPDAVRTSRLSCQVVLAGIDRLNARVPAGSRN